MLLERPRKSFWSFHNKTTKNKLRIALLMGVALVVINSLCKRFIFILVFARSSYATLLGVGCYSFFLSLFLSVSFPFHVLLILLAGTWFVFFFLFSLSLSSIRVYGHLTHKRHISVLYALYRSHCVIITLQFPFRFIKFFLCKASIGTFNKCTPLSADRRHGR